MRRYLWILFLTNGILLSVILPKQGFAQTPSPTIRAVAPTLRLGGPTGTRGNFIRDALRPTIREGIEERKNEIEKKKEELRNEVIQRIRERIERMVERLRNIIARLRRHIDRIREYAGQLARERGLDVAAVEEHLRLAEDSLAGAEAKLRSLVTTLEGLAGTDATVRDAVQTIKDALLGSEGIRRDIHNARTHIREALAALRELARSARPTTTPPAGGTPTLSP